MNANPDVDFAHPQFVAIPDPRHARGIRAYAEPAEPHPLQRAFLDPAEEAAWLRALGDLLAEGRADEADARLTAALAGFDGAIAQLCKATAAEDVVLEGWDDLLPILAEWEGPPITAITLGLTNVRDLVFGGGPNPEPDLLIRLYSDDAFAFSRTAKADLLAESAKEMPAWIGAEEDVEFYCSFSGVAALNTALVNCKHRHFLRDGTETRAPGGYVEYRIGCWLLATRFLQAVTRAVAAHGAPSACRLVVGTVDINADFVAVMGSEPIASAAARRRPAAEPGFAALTLKYVPRKDPVADPAEAPATLRQRLSAVQPDPAPTPPRGLLARLIARFRRG